MIELVNTDPLRMGLAAGAGVLWMLMSGVMLTRGRARSAAVAVDALILSASQTGQAEELARHTHKALGAGGLKTRLLSVDKVSAEDLQQAKLVLAVASTTGVGDAPDDGRAFEGGVMKARPDLSAQSFAVLALGDRSYDDFCAFGHRLHDWFTACGATAKKPVTEVDDLDPAALKHWEDYLKEWGGASVQEANPFSPARLIARERLNPNSEAAGLYRIDLAIPEGASWVAGDLAEILTPSGHRRDYSIASLPEEGVVCLFVREVIKADGSRGEGSGLLTALPEGDAVPLRLKSHKNFHTPEGNGPVLLIAAGSGLAGLRPHLIDLAARGRPTWLIYGERHPQKDGGLADQMRGWREGGRMRRLDLAFSRPDHGAKAYVQDVVALKAGEVRDWLGQGGHVLVCGGLDMGRGVEAALKAAMGADWLDAALRDGRYRRDLY
ncbi:NADPH cytochrome P450 oxidoreductase family protein [Asticcacaulis sp. AND118]|uniref:NADPH cytochrome P450 oxidoreductase family protein n=1 Tax=Asticcacaulis sp. AND118 TaxID=2840468 RepID=UPI001CFF7B9C|nr:NADPH cytochrome P450 oxidoreductase family protein [Asticcacaulis sp. AND118]UDF05113.1 flavodoxin domain-containing protein [Asticcacaulis sp. AND118]